MTKICLVSDTHWGVRNDHIGFLDNLKTFLDDTFFPYLDKHKIEYVVHLGDLVDRRKYINFHTVNRLRTDFLDKLEERRIFTMFILGNHDIFYKNSSDINALQEIVSRHVYTYIVDKIDTLEICNFPILMVPWIHEGNIQQTLAKMNKTKAQVCFGHFELQGFEWYRGLVNTKENLFDSKALDKFDMVCTGHFHHKSSSGNIHYLGATTEQNWSDYDDPRGFHIFDTETRELEFIRNPHTMYAKIFYDDRRSQDFSNLIQYHKKLVKVIVKHKDSLPTFDLLIENLEHIGVLGVQIVDDYLNQDIEGVADFVDQQEDTMAIFRNYVEQLSIDQRKKTKLDKVISNLHSEALALE